MLVLTRDEHVHVRYAAALALGEVARATRRRRRAEPLMADVDTVFAELAGRDGGDKWFRAAILTSLPTEGDRQVLLRRAAATVNAEPSEDRLALVQDLARLCAFDAVKVDPPGKGSNNSGCCSRPAVRRAGRDADRVSRTAPRRPSPPSSAGRGEQAG